MLATTLINSCTRLAVSVYTKINDKSVYLISTLTVDELLELAWKNDQIDIGHASNI